MVSHKTSAAQHPLEAVASSFSPGLVTAWFHGSACPCMLPSGRLTRSMLASDFRHHLLTSMRTDMLPFFPTTPYIEITSWIRFLFNINQHISI